MAAAPGLHISPAHSWSTLRSLLRSGACDKPDGDGYPWLLLYAMQCLADGVHCEAGDVAAALREDPAVLAEDIWDAFRVATDNEWLFPALQSALVELAAEGAIDRETLVDETLAAVRPLEDPSLTVWAAGGMVNPGTRVMRFHDRVLKPTPTELAARQDQYLRCLESDRDALAGFALGNLTRLGRAHELDGRDLLDRLEPLVALRSKAQAKRAVALARRVLAVSPGLRAEGLAVVADALAHDSAEVQLAALELLERHAGDVDPPVLEPFLAGVEPSLAGRLGRLAGAAPPAEPTPPAVAVPPASVVDPDRVPRLLPGAVLEPVDDVEGLLDLAGLLLEGHDDADAAERFVDGLSRLCDRPVPLGRRTALLRRAKRRHGTVWTLVRAWLGWEREHLPIIGWTGPTAALGRRLTAVAARVVEGRADVLLSAPTHRGGFLDPDVLAARLEHAEAVEDHDLAQALLRLPALGRAAGLERLAAVSGEPGAIARALLAGTPWTPDGAGLPAAWDSAAVLAEPGRVVFETAGPEDPWYGYSYDLQAPPRSPARELASFEPVMSFNHGDEPLVQRWLASVWPGRRDLYFANVVRTLYSWSYMVEPRAREARLSAAFGVMRHLDEPLGPYADILLAHGLLATGGSRPPRSWPTRSRRGALTPAPWDASSPPRRSGPTSCPAGSGPRCATWRSWGRCTRWRSSRCSRRRWPRSATISRR